MLNSTCGAVATCPLIALLVASLSGCSASSMAPASTGRDAGLVPGSSLDSGAGTGTGGSMHVDVVSKADAAAAPVQPTLLAAGQTNPVAIAVDGQNVYWFNNGTSKALGGGRSEDGVPEKPIDVQQADGQVMKCSHGGCGQTPTALVSKRRGFPGRAPIGFAADGTHVYWSDATGMGGTFRCSVDGCNDQPEVVSSSVGRLVPDETNVYFLVAQPPLEIESCSAAGCGSTPTTLWSAGSLQDPWEPEGIAADASDVYFAAASQSWTRAGVQHLMKCAKGGCDHAPTVVMERTVMAGAAAIYDIALDGDSVYFTDDRPAPAGQVLKCAKAGCGDQPTVLADGLTAPTALASDGTNVYWIDSLTSVRSCAVGGCNNAPTTLYVGTTDLVDIALDERNVYFTDVGTAAEGGRVWMLPK